MNAPTVEVICGDALEELRKLPAESVDLVVTDPPYLLTGRTVSIGHDGVAKRTIDSNTMARPWGYSLDWVDVVGKTQAPRHWIVFAHFLMLGELQERISRYAVPACLFVWRKSNAPNMVRPVPRMDCEFILWARREDATWENSREFRSMVIDVPAPQAGCMATERLIEKSSGKALHPTQKPLAIVRPFVFRMARPGDTILDPFAGTGTMGVAALEHQCGFIGIEREQKYVEMMRQRLAGATQPLPFEEYTA